MRQYTFFHRSACAAALLAVLMTAGKVAAQEVYRIQGAPARVLLRTNALYDLAASPNIGVEIQTDHGMAWQLDYIGAWWNSGMDRRYYSNYAFQTEVRYYIGRNTSGNAYTGRHAGIYGQMATYDFEFGGRGYQSRNLDYTYGVGVSYGKVIPLTRRLSIDLTAGLGYFRTKYDVYDATEWGYRKKETRTRRFWGPTRLEASLVWIINKNK